MADANNQKALTLEEQGTEAGNDEVTEEVTEPVEEENKGTPDDPKLLRAKMTQATQNAAATQKEFDEYKAKVGRLAGHPKFKPLYDEVIGGKKPETKEEELSDDDSITYRRMKPFLKRFQKEEGVSSEDYKQDKALTRQEQADAASLAVADRFYIAHPEVEEGGEISNAVATIINESARRGEVISPETAYKLYKVDNADVIAKSKATKELEAKKGASLLKPKGTAPAQQPERKMSKRESMEAAMETVGGMGE